jgi:hypothetical protein
MSAKRLGIVLFLAAATGTLGCLDNGGGNQDQWMNTDAYVGPEVSASNGDGGGVTCGDAPSFGSPTRLSDDLEPDGGVVHVQYEVTMSGAGGDGGVGAVNVAWIDRSLATPLNPTLRAVRVPAGASTGDILDLPRPTGCDALVDPALAATAAGTVLLAATCITGTESQPTASQILLFRSTNGLTSFEDPLVVASCDIATDRCDLPAVAATSSSVFIAWTDWTYDQGTGTGVGIKVWRSDDDGVSLAEEITAPGTFTALAGPRLAISPADEVHVAFTGAFSLPGTMYAAAAKLDTATAFGTAEVLGTGSDPRLTASQAGVYVVWIAGGDTLQEAHDTGNGFSSAAPITQPSGTTSILSPGVAADPDGNVHLFWLGLDDTGWNAYYSLSTDQGAGWSGPLLISGPFDGDESGSNAPHWIGAVDLHAWSDGVTLGWGDTGSKDTMTGVTNIYLAQRVCP